MAILRSDLDTLPLDQLKRLVAQLLARVSALEEEIRQLREENARLKALPKRPKLAPGSLDQARTSRPRRAGEGARGAAAGAHPRSRRNAR
jgi:hypothetical protein